MILILAGISAPIYLEPQEMGRAGDARVVVADHFFAMQPKRVVRLVEAEVLERQAQILLDARLVLARRRDDARADDAAIGVDLVAMP